MYYAHEPSEEHHQVSNKLFKIDFNESTQLENTEKANDTIDSNNKLAIAVLESSLGLLKCSDIRS